MLAMVKATRLQVLLTAILLLSVEHSAARAQSFTINSVAANTPNFGNVGAALTGATVFQISAAGVVSVVSGSGGDTPSGTQVASTVNIRCSNPNCSTGTALVKIAKLTTVTGRASAVSSFTVQSGTATVGTVTVNGDGSIQFPVTNLANNQDRTIFVGMRMPIAGDNSSSSTTATAQWAVGVAKSPTVPTSGTTGTATATVRKSISATTTSLGFGPIRRPNSGSGTVTINASTGARTAGGSVAPGLANGGGSGRGTVVVAGQGSQTFNIGLSSPFTLSNGTTSLSSTAVGSSAGPYTLTSGGAFTLGVGGVLTVPSSATTGNYTGAITATVAYN